MKKNYDTPFSQVMLDKTQMDPDEFPSHLIDNKWHCVWWTGVRKDGEPAAELGWKRTAKKKNAKAQLAFKEPEPVNPSYDFHITREVDGKIRVYGCVLINEYSAE